ncbi:MAG: SigE family RNA polymerase sigma factor [Nitriliruptoraceae bacterium]|nr:SigE family RNA polymerase sigma factor [Nitriliruptoraceae bacterium]
MSTIIAAVAGGEALSRTLASMPDGFASFYATHHRDLTGLAYTLTGSWTVAEDLAQEAFVRAYRDWDRVGDYDRPDSWIRTVLVNLATSRGRRLAAEGRALIRLRGHREDQHTDPLPGAAERFWAAVRSLPRRQAQAVALHYHDERSIEEIAVIMDCAEGTVKSHLHAARRTLADRLEEPDHRPEVAEEDRP